MTPQAIYIAVRDLLIAAALGFMVYRIYIAGENTVRVKDLAAVQSQLQAQQKQLQAYIQQVSQANAQRIQDAQTITAAIAAHSRQPILVRLPVPSGPHPVPASTTGSSAQPAGPRSSDSGSGGDPGSIDLRPAIAAFEQRYEASIADCREALSKWPK